ncbi:hypothetical protein Q1695_002355 [Nippostrongylus brasiliensis]|nr:hypothetical protein Q1695_002355 [Nippostrongylus brasiliensis]
MPIYGIKELKIYGGVTASVVPLNSFPSLNTFDQKLAKTFSGRLSDHKLLEANFAFIFPSRLIPAGQRSGAEEEQDHTMIGVENGSETLCFSVANTFACADTVPAPEPTAVDQ